MKLLYKNCTYPDICGLPVTTESYPYRILKETVVLVSFTKCSTTHKPSGRPTSNFVHFHFVAGTCYSYTQKSEGSTDIYVWELRERASTLLLCWMKDKSCVRTSVYFPTGGLAGAVPCFTASPWSSPTVYNVICHLARLHLIWHRLVYSRLFGR